MKRSILTAAFLSLFIAGAYAQTAKQQIKQFSPIEKKELNLSYLGKGSSSVLERIKENDVTSRYMNKYENAVVDKETEEKIEPNMPIMQPDSSAQFHILAMKPDSTILYHIQIKKSGLKNLPQ
jgi:predicted RNA-binding protein